MSEFTGGSSGNGKFDAFLEQEVHRGMPTDDEIRQRIIEERHEKAAEERREKQKTIAKRVIATVLGVGIAFSGIALVRSTEKSFRQEDYNNAMKNNIWVEYGVTTNMEDLSDSEYADMERKVLSGKTENVYDLKHGEGSFEDLSEKQQKALVGETYEYYGKTENKPEDIKNVDEVHGAWADAELGEDLPFESIVSFFDRQD